MIKVSPLFEKNCAIFKSLNANAGIDYKNSSISISPQKEYLKKNRGLSNLNSPRNLQRTVQKQNENKLKAQKQRQSYNLLDVQKNMEIKSFLIVKSLNKPQILPKEKIKIPKLILPKHKQIVEKQQNKHRYSNFQLKNNQNLRKKYNSNHQYINNNDDDDNNNYNETYIKIEDQIRDYKEQRKFCNLDEGFIDQKENIFEKDILDMENSFSMNKSWDLDDFECEESMILELKQYEKIIEQKDRRNQYQKELKNLGKLNIFSQK